MAADAGEGDIELVCAGHANAGRVDNGADGEGDGVAAECEIGLWKAAAVETVIDHGLGAEADFFRRLGIDDERAGPVGPQRFHGLGEADQPGGVGIMAAGVDHRNFGAIGEALRPAGGAGQPVASSTEFESISARNQSVGPGPFLKTPTTPVLPTPAVT